MRWWWLVLVVCACGRVGFDAPPGRGDARTGDGTSSADASTLAPCDPTACANAGGTCQSDVCVIDCGALQCMGMVTCPPDSACQVTCSGAACTNGVNCGSAGACTVTCSGIGSCMGGVTCNSPTCNITCTSTSCQDGVTCGPGTCTIDCSSLGACQGGINCRTSCSCTATGNLSAGNSRCPTGCAQGQGCMPACGPGC